MTGDAQMFADRPKPDNCRKLREEEGVWGTLGAASLPAGSTLALQSSLGAGRNEADVQF